MKRLSLLNEPVLSVASDHLIIYPVPTNINYFWSFGSLAGICLLIQIATGTYSPVKRFMDLNEMNCVLNKNILANGTSWTLPIIFQIQKKQKESLPIKGLIAIANEDNKQIIGVINVENIENIKL